nr:reverse transcriptase domain-containing protein [Tanacetum cinerariifolium]
LRQFLGLAGYYQRFIKGFSLISKPLTKLTQKNKNYEWGEDEEYAFLMLKQKLCSAPILALPEGSNDFVVYYDASIKGFGAVLMQREKANVVANALSRKEREKLIRVRALVMTVHTDLFKRILKAQTKAMTSPKNPEWLRLDLGYRRSVNQVGSLLAHKRGHFKGLWEVIHFEKRGKLSPRYVGLFKIIDRVGPVEYKLELPRELQGIHNTFYVSNLKKCLADENLIIPLKEIQLDDKFHFIEELVEITDREVKQLKQSRIPIVKVR